VLSFALDETLERALRVSRILHELEQEPPVDLDEDGDG
jgi:hypothetical protein